ncbi:MAG TPA: sigma-70 family RNA polymerase sigma factor, partial [Acidimicrobiales bacterium]|nr:sigma-70 family RNA polymerase sigma factor [Acidimicrobiales bacterium]
TDAPAWLDRTPVPTDRDLTAACDSELAEALSLRQLAALDEAFRRHATQVARTVRRIAGGYHVDDVVQEVFLLLWRAPERFRPECGSLATFLAMLAHCKAVDVLRTDGAWQRRNVQHGCRWAPEDDVEETTIARVSASELWEALRALPMSERVAIELAFFGGYTYRQVADQLGEPEGTIKSRIRAGLRRLEGALQGLRAGALD